MAVSIASTLTPYLWRGEPTVVIRGKFVLGLARKNDSSALAYFAPNLYLEQLAAAPLNKTFSLQVLGRSVQAGQSEDGPVYSGIDYISQMEFASHKNGTQGDLPADPYYSEGPFFMPKVYCKTALSNMQYNTDAIGESNAHTASQSNLGTLVCPDLRIVLRGELFSLDITKIAAVGFPGDTSTLGYDIATKPWSLSYKYSGFDGYGVGWRATDVHVYDNPALRGNVTAGDVPVIWD